MGSLTPRPYGFRAFNERRSQRGRRMYEGEPFGEQATTPAPLATQANAVTVGVDPRQPPLEQADRPGEFRVLSVRRMGPRDGSPASPPPRGRIVDWVV